MSLAMFAAPFNENSNSNENFINKKKQAHNKTQKTHFKENFDTEKVNSVLEKIHNDSMMDEDSKDTLGDFNPPPPPQSAGVSRTAHTTENMMNMSNEQNNLMFRTLGRTPQPNYDANSDLDLNNYQNNYGDSKTAEEYYKNILPKYLQSKNYHPQNKLYYNNQVGGMSDNGSQDVLLQKINYMITLLEEQQDEKTNNVTEEVVLYSFLGIFIIFIVDSFAKVGKYVR